MKKDNGPIAIAVLPVEGGPAMRIALPAILDSCTIFIITPAALRALNWPTIPSAEGIGSSLSSKPKPLICECAPILSNFVGKSFDWVCIFVGVDSLSERFESTAMIDLNSNHFRGKSRPTLHQISQLSDKLRRRFVFLLQTRRQADNSQGS